MADFTADSTTSDPDTEANLGDFLKRLATPNYNGDPDAEKNADQMLRSTTQQGGVSGGGNPASIDWGALADATMKSRLADIDQRFPPGLRHDRPYTVDETSYHDSTRQLTGEYGGVKNRRPMMRNPITGGAVPASPYITPHMLTAAANALVEAKARARADVMRGRDTNDAAVEALAHAMGVDPAMVKGMPLDLAGRIIPAAAQTQRLQDTQKRKETELATARTEQQSAMQGIDPQAALATTGMHDPSDAWQVFGAARQIRGQQDKEAALQAKADLAEQNKNKIAGAMNDLMAMDPAEAARQAPQRLAPFMDQRGEHYATLIGQFDQRAQQAQVAQANQQKQAAAAAAKEQQRAQKDFDTSIGKPIDSIIGAKPKSVKKPKAAGLGAASSTTDEYDVNYHPAILDQMSALRVLAGNAREKDPQFDDKFASAVEMAKSRMAGDTYPAWMNDPKSALDGTGPIDDADPAKTHSALVMIGLALRSLMQGQRPQ